MFSTKSFFQSIVNLNFFSNLSFKVIRSCFALIASIRSLFRHFTVEFTKDVHVDNCKSTAKPGGDSENEKSGLSSGVEFCPVDGDRSFPFQRRLETFEVDQQKNDNLP